VFGFPALLEPQVGGPQVRRQRFEPRPFALTERAVDPVHREDGGPSLVPGQV
jgi:hypothetical protein